VETANAQRATGSPHSFPEGEDGPLTRCGHFGSNFRYRRRHDVRVPLRIRVCVAFVKFGPVFGALATAGFFLLVAVTGVLSSLMLRRRNKERAIVARAARSPPRAILVDPSLVSLIGQATRSLGWQRVAPVMLVGFLAALWLQDARAARRTE
jgi:hypothetical protein